MKVLVTMMLENTHDKATYSACSMGTANKGWNASLKWFLASQGLHTFFTDSRKEAPSPSTDKSPLDSSFHIHMREAQKGISQIKDPLWHRVCADVLKVLGPVAFKDLWKTQFIRISPEGKRAFLSCPNQSIATTLEEYHFVIIGALKKFYPSLSSIETEIRAGTFEIKKVNESPDLQQNCLRYSVNA